MTAVIRLEDVDPGSFATMKTVDSSPDQTNDDITTFDVPPNLRLEGTLAGPVDGVAHAEPVGITNVEGRPLVLLCDRNRDSDV